MIIKIIKFFNIIYLIFYLFTYILPGIKLPENVGLNGHGVR